MSSFLFATPPEGETPAYGALVAAHDRYLRDVVRLILSSASPVGAVGRWVPYALFHHLMQLARAVQGLVIAGYSDEALPVGRSMLSSAANLMFIVGSGNADGWALRYWLQLAEVETRMLKRESGLGRFDKTGVERILAETQTNRAGAIAAAAEEGIVFPDKLIGPRSKKPREDTWTGLSDKALFESLALADWYETEYDYLSTVTHAQAVCLLPLRDGLMAGAKPSLGPHFRPPLAALVASFNAVKFAGLAMVKHYDLLALLAEVDRANSNMSQAVQDYRSAVGAEAMVSSIFAPAAAEPAAAPD